MPGASAQTQPVKALNANWIAGDGDHTDRFELQIITEDDERHVIAPSPDSVLGLLSLVRPDVILLWDPDNQVLIAANIVGTSLVRTPTGVTRADRATAGTSPHPEPA
jgi:hypothetical protein